jgi:hypothetical protein
MRFSLLKCVAIFACTSLVLICSCEKHSVGEFPDVQRDLVDHKKKAVEAGVSPAPHKADATTKASPTPAEFFPETTPH